MSWETDELRRQVDDLRREIDRLNERQQEHLRLIRDLSTESISEEDAEEMRAQIAALIAEVGTLRATVRSLEADRPALANGVTR